MGKHVFENKARSCFINCNGGVFFYKERHIRLLLLWTLEVPIQLPVTCQFWFEYPQFQTIEECAPLLQVIEQKSNYTSNFGLKFWWWAIETIIHRFYSQGFEPCTSFYTENFLISLTFRRVTRTSLKKR